MTEDLNRIERAFPHKITDISKDAECEEYCGCNFNIGQFRIKFRKAKITPKKTGQFVTLWKRNAQKQTEPFHFNDDFDFYIVAIRQQNQFGIFLFPKSVLSEKRILTSQNSEGKRGFRLYSAWDFPKNKQAEKTKNWQSEYFIDFTDERKSIGKFDALIEK